MRKTWLVMLVLAAPLLLGADKDKEFKEFTSKAGKFKVRMPGTPQEKTQNSAAGKFTMYLAQAGPNQGFMAAYADLPIPANESDEMVQKRLDGAVQGAANNVRGKITSQSKINLDKKYPGREMLITVADGKAFMKGRIYLVGKRLYQLLAIGSKDFVDSADAKKFMNSFVLVK